MSWFTELFGGVEGKKKLVVSGGAIATLATLPAPSIEVEIAKYAGITLVAAAHAFAQSYVDAGRVALATKTGQSFKPKAKAKVKAKKKVAR